MHHVFVLDGSLSMNLRSGQVLVRRLPARHRQGAGSPGDGFSVLLMRDTPVWIVAEASQDHRQVKRELEDLRAGHGNASVPRC